MTSVFEFVSIVYIYFETILVYLVMLIVLPSLCFDV